MTNATLTQTTRTITRETLATEAWPREELEQFIQTLEPIKGSSRRTDLLIDAAKAKLLETTETTITRDELAHRLADQRGTTFGTLTTRTDARARKTGNPFGTIYKTARVNVVLGHDYESSVNLQRDREGVADSFKAQGRAWGQHVKGCIVEHKGKLYLRCKVQRSISRHYEDADGNLLDPEAIKPFLPAKRSAPQQGIAREVVERSYSLASILSIAIDGQVYRIEA